MHYWLLPWLLNFPPSVPTINTTWENRIKSSTWFISTATVWHQNHCKRFHFTIYHNCANIFWPLLFQARVTGYRCRCDRIGMKFCLSVLHHPLQVSCTTWIWRNVYPFITAGFTLILLNSVIEILQTSCSALFFVMLQVVCSERASTSIPTYSVG